MPSSAKQEVLVGLGFVSATEKNMGFVHSPIPSEWLTFHRDGSKRNKVTIAIDDQGDVWFADHSVNLASYGFRTHSGNGFSHLFDRFRFFKLLLQKDFRRNPCQSLQWMGVIIVASIAFALVYLIEPGSPDEDPD